MNDDDLLPPFSIDRLDLALFYGKRSRWVKDTLDARGRHAAALHANKGQPLSTEQLRRIGVTPKGFRSSTGRTPWTQPRFRAAA